MFKAIKELFLGKPAEVATPVATPVAPYKVPEPASTTSIPLVLKTTVPVVEEIVEKPATIYNEKYKVEDDYPGSTRRVAETVLEINVQDVATVTTPAKEKVPVVVSPVIEAAPVKKPRTPKAAPTEKPAAKKAATPKKAAAIKAAPKAKSKKA